MALTGVGCDPEGRALVEATREAGRADAAPPDCLVLSPEGEVLARFRSGAPAEQALRSLRAVLLAHPEHDPGPAPECVNDPVIEGYEAGLDAYRLGQHDVAFDAWSSLIAAYPNHPLRHRMAWHQQRPVFLPPHPDLDGGLLDGLGVQNVRHRERDAHLRALASHPRVRWSRAGLPLVQIPKGTFTMGGSPAQKSSELPHRQVTLSADYWMGAWPITLRLWTEVMEPQGPTIEGWRGDVPKTGLSFSDVARFCRALSERDGWGYRLPTEAEWEYAARGGLEGAVYPWGDAPIDPSRANYANTTPLPVASYAPNAFGLFDMVGNCPEWTSDYHLSEAYSLTPSEVTDPTGPPRDDARTPVTRVVRGGACQRPFMALLCRNSRRLAAPETPPPWMAIGARLVAEIPEGAS